MGKMQSLWHSSAVSPHSGWTMAKKTKPVVAMTSNRCNQIIYSWILQVLKRCNSIPEVSFGAAGAGDGEARESRIVQAQTHLRDPEFRCPAPVLGAGRGCHRGGGQVAVTESLGGVLQSNEDVTH